MLASRHRRARVAAAFSRWRFVVLALALGCLANIISYTDRANLSIAIVPMAEEFGYDAAAEGGALASFFVGYATTQVLGGWLALRCGPKRVLLTAVFLWSLATLLTPAAAAADFGALVAARVLIGMGEGLLLPCLHALAVRWVPRDERSTAAALMTSGQFIGSVCALLAAPLIEEWWRYAFYLFGAVGLVWCPCFALLAASTPEAHGCVSPAELRLIRGGGKCHPGGLAGTDAAATTRHDNGGVELGGGDDGVAAAAVAAAPQAAVPWRKLLTSRASLAIFVAHATHNWGWYLLLSWLPAYLTQQGARLTQAGFLTLLPHVTAALLSNGGAAFTDRVLLGRLRLPMAAARKRMNAAAQFGPGVAFAALAALAASGATAAPPPAGAPPPPPGEPTASGALAASTIFATAAVGLGALTHSGFWANLMDVAPRHTGVLLGISNTMATFPGILCNLTAGAILANGWGWAPIFALAAVFEAIGGTTFWLLAEGEAQF